MAEQGLDINEVKEWFVLESAVLGGERVLVVNDPVHREEARSEHPDMVIYSPAEVRELLDRNANPMFTRRVHKIKKLLDGEVIPRRPRNRHAARWLPQGEGYRRVLREMEEEKARRKDDEGGPE